MNPTPASCGALPDRGVGKHRALLDRFFRVLGRADEDLVREGVLEGVFRLRKQAGLVEKLGGPQLSEPLTQPFFPQLGNSVE